MRWMSGPLMRCPMSPTGSCGFSSVEVILQMCQNVCRNTYLQQSSYIRRDGRVEGKPKMMVVLGQEALETWPSQVRISDGHIACSRSDMVRACLPSAAVDCAC